jgi:hypothetical protein
VRKAYLLSLSPISLIAPDGGPIKTNPSDSTMSTKDAFSDKNPYPGWMAVAPVFFAMDMILSMRR